MKKFLRTVWHIVKNKYVAATIIFLIFFVFLGENSLLVTNRLNREVSQLQKDVAQYEQGIREDSIAAVSLVGNPEAIETYGREEYYMKRANEDIFIIKD